MPTKYISGEPSSEPRKIVAGPADYSAIPNPGLGPNTRLLATGGALIASMLVAGTMINWPTDFGILSTLVAPIVFVLLFTVGVFLVLPQKMNAFQIAIMEFKDLGLGPETIGRVIVENRAHAREIDRIAKNIINSRVRGALEKIADETLEIIDGFRDDPSDVARSERVLQTCLGQTKKIVANYVVIESRRDTEQTEDATEQAIKALRGFASTLEEQHRRNLDNNTSALEIDVEVSEDLLREYN